MSEHIDTHAMSAAHAFPDDLITLPDPATLEPSPADPSAPESSDLLFDDFSTSAFAKTPLWLVGDVTGQVIDLWMHGKIDQDKAHAALAALVVTESDGTQWTLGATTRRWFKRLPGGAWRLTRPPVEATTLVGPAEQSVEDALRLLGVNPEDINIEAQSETSTTATLSNDGDLLDDLLEQYGS